MASRGFTDRTEAGRLLAEALRAYADRSDVVVLGLPRGGVPVAFEVAGALRVPMDVLLVRKLGLPAQEELAMGAIASGGGRVLNQDVLRQAAVGDSVLQRVVERESRELERREVRYRADRAPVEVRGRVVVGLPVALGEAVENLRKEADEVVAVLTPESFLGVGRWYGDFRQVSDAEVRELPARAWGGQSEQAPG